MEKIREFAPADRYVYDWGLCSEKNGFAQVDTWQDASYYGTWANPDKLLIFNYCEGDTCLTKCLSEAEFVSEIRALKEWADKSGGDRGFRGIDPGLNYENRAKWHNIGLGDLLH
jgi:hypothetical protein